MSNSMMQALANDVANWFKGTTFPAAPTTVYVALLTTNASKNDGTSLVECADSAYARQPITCASGFSAVTQTGDGSHQQFSNAAVITFPDVAGSAVTVVGLAIYTAASGGTLLDSQSVTSQAVSTGNGYQIAIGALILEF
jgi:hypothetical protein